MAVSVTTGACCWLKTGRQPGAWEQMVHDTCVLFGDFPPLWGSAGDPSCCCSVLGHGDPLVCFLGSFYKLVPFLSDRMRHTCKGVSPKRALTSRTAALDVPGPLGSSEVCSPSTMAEEDTLFRSDPFPTHLFLWPGVPISEPLLCVT